MSIEEALTPQSSVASRSPNAPGAVFLSYASQDAAAAERIAAALRTAAIEVRFDNSELRGGDAWNQMIRRRIPGCARFVPVISCQTQQQLEGYFRREWRIGAIRPRVNLPAHGAE
jgi:hypothetical protein